MDKLEDHLALLRAALIDQDQAAATREQHWLMGALSAALLQQDQAAMMTLRGHLADLAPLADHYGDALPGERWRAAWEILLDFTETIRPLEQVRLAAPGQLSGLLLRHISDTPGITPSELARRVGKEPNHISNTLRALSDQGLVQRVPAGRNSFYHLAAMGVAALAQQQPLVETVKPTQPGKVINFAHAKKERLQGRDTRELPARWLMRA
ncbi:MAG: MarR family transcriptional regulator [Sulfuricellaceae bacterium]